MVEIFFSKPQSNIFSQLQMEAITLISGPNSCGKTSLLFQLAINCANNNNSNVVFICSKRRLEYKPPFLSKDIDPSSNLLERIQMKYVEDEEGIKKYFAAFHLHNNFPTAVIIDDFGDHFSDRKCQQKYGNARAKDLAMVRTLALCHDAISHANKKLQPDRSCSLVLADTHQGENPRLLFIYKRWVSCILTIQGTGSSSFILKDSTISASRMRTRAVKYSIALQYLILEEILEG